MEEPAEADPEAPAPGMSLFPNTRRSAPPSPSSTPPAFITVMGSFSQMAANIMVTIGSEVVMMEASTGDVMETPVI